ncbi:nucleotidyltransferase family protein [Stagnihabitans tardus]|uniref:NTP transferase domain-containing protein n=1 Tax=Stagnihabitans tardus TaxID=2699202 RepID=A0AAE4Y8V1_9RHOB|nr:nucleotidyltransferase family protein [Stagnihabitans tardus]NBZ86813.1 NTP transferase domain-containing protein [Stagnihabitans tardus]
MTFPLFLFAAGFGTRMGALTADRPKPLVQVAGQTLLSHALALTETPVVGPRFINTHYRAEQIVAALPPGVTPVHEPVILETGGGLKAALPQVGDGPVMTLNTDAIWTGANPLEELAEAWSDEMDGLLLLAHRDQATGHKGAGDFLMQNNRLTRANGAVAPIYLGAQILRAGRLREIPETVFSMNRLWDHLIAEGRLYGVLHQGGWCDVGHPGAIPLAEAMLHG